MTTVEIITFILTAVPVVAGILKITFFLGRCYQRFLDQHADSYFF
ncbi:hypothetical protein SAMN05216391_1611 [Lachnospiraceae bacterium KHCPX20]|nr:hypothetical protein SAMN05216391_1611 [Lachnospiraceae bacterium KHCPX20]